MDETLKNEFKDLLITQKKKLEEELTRFTKKNEHVKGDREAIFPNMGDEEEQNALEVSEYDKNRDLEQNMELDLQAVNEALDKIEKGTYGKCSKCGQDIDVERLRANPQAKECMSCNE